MTRPSTSFVAPKGVLLDRISVAGSNLTRRAVGRHEWRGLATGFEDHNYRQCWDYAEAMAERTGAQAEHLCIEWEDGPPLGLASVRVKRMPAVGRRDRVRVRGAVGES